ncbi:MAG: polysaccharide deacetylase family protein [Bacteroidota bacterium]
MRKSDPRHIVSYLSPLFSLRKLIRTSNQKFVFPFYHAVNNNPGPHLRHLYPIKTVKAFIEDLEILLQHFSPLSPSDLFSIEKCPAKPGFLISFDDGLKEAYEFIAPQLKKRGIPAIFFLNNNFIDNRDLFYRYKVSLLIEKIESNGMKKGILQHISEKTKKRFASKHHFKRFLLALQFHEKGMIDSLCEMLEVDIDDFLKREKPYLTGPQILDLKNEGFYFGAHSFEHPEFHHLDPKDQKEEVMKSTQDIRKRFDLDYSFFSFPFSDYGISPEVLQSIHSGPGFKQGATFGTGGMKSFQSFPHFQRLSMEKYQGNSERILITEYLYFKLKKLLAKH